MAKLTVKEFVQSTNDLTLEDVIDTINAVVATDCIIAMKEMAEDLEACFSIAHAMDRLSPQIDSNGTIEYYAELHNVKHAFYTYREEHGQLDRMKEAFLVLQIVCAIHLANWND